MEIQDFGRSREKLIGVSMNNLDKKIKQFEDKLQPLLRKKKEIEKQNRIQTNKKLIGKCFKTKNCYSSGEEWDLFIKIIGVSKEGFPVIEDFQKTIFDVIEFDKYKEIVDIKWFDADEINPRIYEKEKKKILKELSK